MAQVSPGYVTRENEVAIQVPAYGTTILGLIGGAAAGPVREIVDISDLQQYVSVFGQPVNPMGRVAQHYLKRGMKLKVLRVGTLAGDPVTAYTYLTGDTGKNVYSPLDASGTPDENPYIGVVIRNALKGFNFLGGYRLVGDSEWRYFLVQVSGNVSKYPVDLTRSVEDEKIGEGDGTVSPSVSGLSRYPLNNDGTSHVITLSWTSSSVVHSVTADAVGDFSGNTEIDAGALRENQGTWQTPLFFDSSYIPDAGTDITVSYDWYFSAATWSLSGSSFVWATRTLTLTDSEGEIDDSTVFTVPFIAGAEHSLLVRAIRPGAWGNSVKVLLSAGTLEGYKITILKDDFVVETWDNLADKAAILATLGTDPDTTESEYLYMNEANTAALPVFSDLPQERPLVLGSGSEPLVEPLDVIAGLSDFKNSEACELDLVAAPDIAAEGVDSAQDAASVAEALIALCEARGDCLALVDPPVGLDTQGVRDWHNGTGYTHAAFDSSYGAVYWPWNRFYCPYEGQTVSVAPSGPVSTICVLTDHFGEVWSALAGSSRGKAEFSQDLELRPSRVSRETLCSEGNVVNCFLWIKGDGIYLWGQRTLKRTSSPLDRVNIRRLLFYLKKKLTLTAKTLVFEQNVKTLWSKLSAQLEEILLVVEARRGIYSFRIVCDSSTNPKELIDTNVVAGKILIQPVKTGEVLIVDWTLLSSGAELVASFGPVF